MTKIRAYLRILVCGLALQAGQLPAAADWLYTPGAGPSKFMSFNASSSPVAGTGACAATNVDCMVFSPVNTAGAPLFTSTTPGRVDPTGTTTQPVSAASLPLPTGAATSALQTTGNTSLASILTALGSPMQASGGSVTANAGTNLNTSLLAVESGGNIAAINTGQGAPGATACTTDTASCNQNQQLQRIAQRLSTINTTLGTPFQAAGSIGNTGFNALQGGAANAVGNPFFVSPGTGATFPISAASLPLPTGAATQTTLASLLTALGTPFQAGGSIGNTSFIATQSTAANLNMTCANCSGSGASGTDEGGFTAGSSIFAPSGGFFQTSATSNALTTGQWGAWQMTANRAGFVNLRNASGTEIGTAGAPVRTDPTGTTAQIVTQSTAANLNATVVGNGTFAVQATLQAGSALAGKFGIDQTTPGTTNGVQVNAALPAGANLIGKTGIDQTTPGTTNAIALSTLGANAVATGNGTSSTGTLRVAIASDNTANSNPWLVNPGTAANWGVGTSTQNSATVANGQLALAQFNTAPTTITTGNMSPLQMDNAGNLLVNIKAGAGSGGTAIADGATFTIGTTNETPASCYASSGITPTTGKASVLSCDLNGNLRVVGSGLAQSSTTSGQSGSLIMAAVTTGAPTYTTAQTSPLSLDTAGNLRVNVVAGGGSGGTSSSFGSAFPGTGTAAGGLARTSDPSAATNGNMVGWTTDKAGKQIHLPYSIPELFVTGAASATGTGATTIISAGAAGIKNYITSVQCGRDDAGTTAIRVTFNDAASTPLVLPNTGGGGGNNVTFPVPIATAAATAFQFTSSAGTTTVRCNAQGYQGV